VHRFEAMQAGGMFKTRNKPCARCCQTSHPAQKPQRPRAGDCTKAHASQPSGQGAAEFRRSKASLSGRHIRLLHGVFKHRGKLCRMFHHFFQSAAHRIQLWNRFSIEKIYYENPEIPSASKLKGFNH
jgi:hypothetical protein